MNPGDLLETIDHYGDSNSVVLGNIGGDKRKQLLVPNGTLCVFIKYTSKDKRKVVILCGSHLGWLWKEEVRRVESVAGSCVMTIVDHADINIMSLAEKQ